MMHTLGRHLSRWMPRPEAVEPPGDAWPDTDSSRYSSSYELSQGLEVIEHFEHFADTRPALHAAQGQR
jgi:hypothetical protein